MTKCLAKFTSGAQRCDQFMAMQIQGEEGHGFQRLVELTKSWNSNRTIWENALTTLVNLSFVESLRPNLGNAGVIWLFIFRCNNVDDKLAPGDFLRTVSALCLYCYESVNRMKMRDSGGLRLFVEILQDPLKDSVLKEKIIKSLMQFSYDDMSLKVLQHVGLVTALIDIISKYNQKNLAVHSCEKIICDMQNDSEGKNENAEEDCSKIDNVEKNLSENNDSCIDRQNHTVSNTYQEEKEDEPNEFLLESEGSNIAFVEDAPTENSRETKKEEKQYRINSPSYREVQDEVEEFTRIRSSLPGSSWMSDFSDRVGMSPFYSRSPSASPTRSNSPALSFDQESVSCFSSPQWSSESSPTTNSDDRGLPTYSPIENFSDDDDQEEEENPNLPENVPRISKTLNVESSSPQSSKKLSPSYIPMCQPFYFPTIKRSISSSSISSKTHLSEDSQVGMILQILSR